MKILSVLCLAATLTPAIAKRDVCARATIDFSELPNGNPLNGGDYLSNEWYDKYGLTLSATGGYLNKPRLFDTLHPGTKTHGDLDLGSPNEHCGGPGKGEGGEPDAVGANCEPLGNVLIIQEPNDNVEIPDDNVEGGVITFRFEKPVRVRNIGLLDIDYESFLRVKTSKSGKVSSSDIPVPMLGDNSVQKVRINIYDVVQLDLNLRRSGAITFISFCYDTELAGIGDVCYGDSTCETDYCFNEVLPDGTIPAGVCSCNPSNNVGCEEEKECATSPLVDIGPPECFLPMEATCSLDSDCLSDHCFHDQCVCNTDLNFPCMGDEVCTFREDSGFGCRNTLNSIDEDCLGDTDCETAFCWADWFIEPDQPGRCKCNYQTNEGCSDGRDCLFPTRPGSAPSCFLSAGSTCVNDADCYSESCVNNTCTVCNGQSNYPCPPDLICVPDEFNGYDCLETTGDLKSKYLRDDAEAQAFLDNDESFKLPSNHFLAPVGNLEWRIINAMRMTGSDHDSTGSGETIDAERLRSIDAELVKAEAMIAAQAAKLPNFSEISGPDYLDNIPQSFAAHMYATILEMFNFGPIKYQTLSNECLLANMIPQMCGALVDMGVEEGSPGCKSASANLREDQIIQSPELFGFANVRREIRADELPSRGDSSTMSYVGTLIHEFVHDLDARYSNSLAMHTQYDRREVCSPNLVDFGATGTPFRFVGDNGSQNIDDFVSQYAAGLSNQYQDYRPWEDVAESVESFMLIPNYFKTRAASSTVLQAKYDYIRDNMFGGIEFENLNDLVVPETYTVPSGVGAIMGGWEGADDFEVQTFRVTDIRVRQ